MEIDEAAINAHTSATVVDSLQSKDQLGIDYHRPLFLHASGAPISMSIGMPLVGMENYSLWREAMQFPLLTRNKLCFVDFSIPRDSFGAAYELLWDCCNAIVKSWIMHDVIKSRFDQWSLISR
ncbi:hypothetical protein EJD97_014120 [Solanum chilense]|uniref:Retrotransposon Copia-like N-terminal domain-containing protein n=1 Tax=Solanum chilense TaxID=4083 RepID=A0A6N2AHH9_SOLCI|nr:hypothetical protein EJD97_014120 [Solanum chilense]